MNKKKVIGGIDWADLTVPNADQVRDFYKAVIGYDVVSFDMGGYQDYCMNSPADEETKVGICHSKGTNEGVPPVWLVYINVEQLDASMDACRARGGKVILGPKDMGKDRMCIIEDPAGAVAALYEHHKSS